MGTLFLVMSGISRELRIVALVSFILSLLQIAPAVFMLQVYGRVLATGSTATLLSLSIIMMIAMGALVTLEMIRSRILNRAANKVYVHHVNKFAEFFEKRSLRGERAQGRGNMPSALPHIQSVHGYITSPGFASSFDIPWVPLYFTALFFLHPLLALVALGGVVICVVIGALAGLFRDPEPELDNLYNSVTKSLQDEIFTIKQGRSALGSHSALLKRWWAIDNRRMGRHLGNVMRNITSSMGIKSTRVALQSVMLATASFAVIADGASPAIIVASSILLGRAVDPFIQGLNSVTALKSAIFAAKHVRAISNNIDIDETTQSLTSLIRANENPISELVMNQVVFVPGGTNKVVLRQVDFEAQSGEVIIVTGGSGAGKSSFLRILSGTSQTSQGGFSINGVDSRLFANDVLCKRIGYMPQVIELMQGTILDNIIGFETSVDETRLRQAVALSGIKGLISQLEKGVKERIDGPQDMSLSHGQKAQIGLARALYQDPDVLILDEPAASFDAVALQSLEAVAQHWIDKGGILIAASHRKTDFPQASRVLLLKDGQLSQIDPPPEEQQQQGPAVAQQPAPPSPLPVQKPAAAQNFDDLDDFDEIQHPVHAMQAQIGQLGQMGATVQMDGSPKQLGKIG